MQKTIPTVGTISWGCRLMPAAAAVGLLLALGFAQPASAQNVTTACSTTSLCLDNNYFVTGDYVVGGAVFNGPLVNGLAPGTITIPDPNQPNSTSVPAGADIVAAFLYWETVESTNPGAVTGQHGLFNGYAIDGGKPLGNQQSPSSWSAGGCSGNNQGSKTMHVYRADVRPFLPLGADGNVQGNGSFSVMLVNNSNSGNGVPFTLGASLVIIYRVQSPLVPLNSIILYDGAVAPSNTSSTFTQPMVGFYQAAASPVVKITHIAGNGQANKSEVVTLNSTTLPSVYGAGSAPLPGIYNGSWDNPTWTGANSPINTALVAGDTQTTSVAPTSSGSGCPNWGAIVFSTTVPDPNHDGLLPIWKTNQGYTDAKLGQSVALPGASTTAQDIFVEIDYLSNLDGSAGPYLHSHLPQQAALDRVGDTLMNCDSNGQNCTGPHVHFDVGTNFNFNPQTQTGCKLTPVLGNQQSCPDPYIMQGGTGGNAISEGAVVCKTTTPLCEFPNQAAVTWKGGFLFVKDNPTVPGTTVPLGGFQFGRKDSYHYALFGHALGEPRSFWTTFASTIQNPSVGPAVVAQLTSFVNSGTTATVTVQTPQGLVKPGDCSSANVPPACTDANGDRVTVSGALRQPALNGTYLFTNLVNSGPDSNGVTTTTFNIATTNTTANCTSAPCVANGTYNFNNEPRLAVEYGGPTSTSGHSEVGGGDSAVTFGLWPADDPSGCQADPSVALNSGQVYCVNQVGPTTTAVAGTLLHEIGHTLFLTHGGTFFPNPVQGQQINNSPFSVPNYGLNCNPAFLSSMNYLHVIRGFPDGGIGYSGQTLASLSEAALNESVGIGSDIFTNLPAAHFTRWYGPPNALDIQLGRQATRHCDGTPVAPNEPPVVRVNGSTLTEPSGFSGPIDWNNNLTVPDLTEPVAWQDVNFNGSTSSSPDPPAAPAFNDMQGFNDWINLDLRQVDSRANTFGLSSGSTSNLTGFGGSTSNLTGFGGSVTDLSSFGGSTVNLSGFGGSTVNLSGFGGSTVNLSGFGGSIDQDQETACSTADPPTGLSAKNSNKTIVLNWTQPEVCQVSRKGGYTIWRAVGSLSQFTPANQGQFTPIGTANAPTTTFTDKNVKNNVTYTYFVTDTTTQEATSGPSNLVHILVSF